MNIRRIAFLALLMASVSAFSRDFKTNVTNFAESPVDGSMWIGSTDSGIFRLGRNGRRVWYSLESGHLASDHIKALAFDKEKVLWILDDTGFFTKYTSVEGFKQDFSFPEGISSFCLSRNLSTLYFCTENSELYTYSIDSKSVNSPITLPGSVTSLIPAVEDFSVWAVTADGIIRIGEDGALSTWDELVLDSNLLPFEFDTTPQQNSVEPRSRHLFLLLILAIFVFIIVVYLVYRFIFKRPAQPKNTVTNNEPDVEILPVETKPENISSVTLDTPDTTITRARVPLNNNIPDPDSATGFTKTVLDLIDQNLSNPQFDVDSIAEITGMSRIHVNRKLKSEGSPSPSVLLKDARMSLASRLLKEAKVSVKDVGIACGFSRPSYFATAFKDYFGVSPSDFQANSSL